MNEKMKNTEKEGVVTMTSNQTYNNPTPAVTNAGEAKV